MTRGDGVGKLNEWQRDEGWNCYLSRYGMTAHVERRKDGGWWFEVCTAAGDTRLYATTENQESIPLATRKVARIAAETVMEALVAYRARAALSHNGG